MKNVLVSGYIGFDNFGDEAIFYVLSKHLKELNYNVSALCNNPDKVRQEYDVKAYYFKSPIEILKGLFNCDVLISGGGSLLQNKTSNFSLYYYLFVIIFAKLLFKKVIIFSQGIEPIVGKIPEFITKTVLKSVKYVSVRDERSLNLLSNWNVKAVLTSDPVYSLVENIKPTENKEGLLVQLRDFKNISRSLLNDLAQILCENKIDYVKVLIMQELYDRRICEEFIEQLKIYNIEAELIANKNIMETIEVINNAKYMISTRLHGLIVSNALETNTFALVYDEKVKTLCDELKIENIDIYNYSKEELNAKLAEFLNNKSEVTPYRKYDFSFLDESLK